MKGGYQIIDFGKVEALAEAGTKSVELYNLLAKVGKPIHLTADTGVYTRVEVCPVEKSQTGFSVASADVANNGIGFNVATDGTITIYETEQEGE